MAHNRVVQWSTMSRAWWIYDAAHQCAFRSAYRIIAYLQGLNKPVYYGPDDLGDHVVVYNTRHVALRSNFWRTFKYHNHTRYAGGYSRTSAWRMHEMDPTRVIERAVYSCLAGMDWRKQMMARLHLFPDDDVPQHILDNITGQIRQVQAVPKRLQDYTQEEIDKFPRLFKFPDDYAVESYRRPNQAEPDQHTLKLLRIK
ncbi:hypothetical protein BsWGS_03174 [Bradybaena similaris]